MKKFLSLMFLVICVVFPSKAQLKVDSLGDVSVGIPFNDSKFTIQMGNRRNGLSCIQSNINSTDTVYYGIRSQILSRTKKGFGAILGWAGAFDADITTPAIGVEGTARAAWNSIGVPIGVVGHMQATNMSSRGVGIYGSILNITNSYIDSLYAGFFDGLTKVRGKLIVTNGIQGALLSYSPSPTASSSVISNALSNNSVTSRLAGLSANTFLLDAPASMMNARSNYNSSRFANLTDEEIEEIDSHPRDYEEEEVPVFSDVDKQLYTKQHYCLDADQLEEAFPDLVYENEDGTKSINYVEMVPILVQAINELKSEINTLKENETKARNVKKEATGLINSENVTLLSLGQNKPNPFGTNTEMEVSIPETVQQAFIYVYDLQGKKVEQVDIIARGKQVVRLSSDNLTDGMYMYSLITDGKVVETRRMIVEK